MEQLTFYTNPQSRGRSVRWMLEECGASFDTVLMDFDGSLQSPEYLAINPMGKIPTLRYGDTVITEAAAIILFLADLFPEKQLAPAVGTAERGEYYRLFCFMVGPMEAAIMEKFWKLTPPPGSKRRGSTSPTTAAEPASGRPASSRRTSPARPPTRRSPAPGPACRRPSASSR